MYSVVSFVPVLHAGYLNFFRRHAGAVLYLVGPDLLSDIQYFGREIRALNPEEIMEAVKSQRIFRKVKVLTRKNIEAVKNNRAGIVMPDEDITRHLAEKYFSGCRVVFESAFLRWHQKNAASEEKISPDRKITREEFDREIMAGAYREADRSSDWWRQVGAVAVKNGKVLLTAFNRHIPSPHIPYVYGDPRTPFNAGERIDLSSAAHAETALIAEAGKNCGIGLDGAWLYVTTFPCPPCAYSIILAGIKRVYYAEGYSLVRARDALKSAGVEIIFVDMSE